MLCNYGCGQEGLFKLRSGKVSCSKSINSCPEQKKKNTGGSSLKGKNWPVSRDKSTTGGGWNKGKKNVDIFGIEKAKEIRNRVSKALIGVSKGVAATEEGEKLRRQRISSTMKKNPKSGGMREGSGRGVKTWYESQIAGKVYLRSTYELEYAKWLDENNINWEGNTKGFEYFYQDKIHKYFPDFYLKEEKCYVEVKGFKTEKDSAKWENFPHQLKILYGKDLLELGLKILL